MITFIIIYLIGCIAAFFIIAYSNDKEVFNSDRTSSVYSLVSWLWVAAVIGDLLIDYKPSLKPFKNLFKKKN